MRRFGVEIEIKGISQERAARALNLVGLRATDEGYNHTTRRYWKIVPDGSLNNGFEVVSPPLEGCEGLEAVRAAITALDDAGATVDRACGLHVHFDASDLSAAEIKMIVLRYARFEREIDRFMPPSRRANNNRYCQSIAGFTRRAGWATANTIGDLASLQGDRYFKLNLQSYQRHGTIEFRQHSGTTNAPKVVNWITFLDAFISESRRLAGAAGESPATRPAGLSGKMQRAYDMIAGQATLEELMEALGWQRHTTRAAITRLRQAGAQIESQRRNGTTTYRLREEAAARPAQDQLMNGVPAATATFYTHRAAILAM
mgnify:FL=1